MNLYYMTSNLTKYITINIMNTITPADRNVTNWKSVTNMYYAVNYIIILEIIIEY